MQNRSRLYILVSSFLGLLILLTVVYLVGLARGRGDVQNAVATAQAQAMLAQIVATDTPTQTPTETETPTITPTPSETPTPSPSPTSSPTPASPEEWAQRFRDQSLSALNAISGVDFTSARAEALLRAAAQQQYLVFAPVSFSELSQDPWSVLVVPRTPDGKSLPMLFWQDPNDQNRVRGQILLDALAGSDGQTYAALRAGISQGVMREDPQGRFHALLIERPENVPVLPVYLFAQPSPAADFALIWKSTEEPLWSVGADQSSIFLDEREDGFLPDMVVDAALPPGSELRPVVRAPGTFVEQTPFARQWANSRWTPASFGDLTAGGAVTGYRLQGAGLRSTPLTSMAQVLALLQSGTVESALTYAQRLDLVQQAFGLGLAQPGWWLGIYLDDSGNEVYDRQITSRLRFFDNGDRTRTFDAAFDLDGSGFYKLSAIQQAPSYVGDLVTPAAPLPTFTPTVVSTESATPETAAISTPTPSPTALPAGAPTPPPAPTLSPTPGPTGVPAATSTPTATVSPTASATPSETPTPSPTPLPIPQIPADQPALVSGVTNVTEPARLRGGPGRDFPVLIPVGNGLAVGLFGITEAQDWLLVRIDEPGHPNRGQLGWMFRDLVYTEGNLGLLPVFRTDGTPLTLEAPAPAALPDLPAETPTPEPSATPTPLQTPEVLLPAVDAPPAAGVPPPDPGEFMATLAGDRTPAEPLAPIPALAADGREFALRAESATIEIWGGLLADDTAGWLPAPGELLWPGSTVYVQGASSGAETTAARVRIVGAPFRERVSLVDGSGQAASVAANNAVALVGGDTGVALIEASGTANALWPEAESAARLGGAVDAGIVLPLRVPRYGQDGFLWVRPDGSGLRILAQPFYVVDGIAGDAFTGLWWIERPAAGTDSWQLWNWDPNARRIVLRLNKRGDFFSGASPLAGPSLVPRIVAARPRVEGDNSLITVLLDTSDAITQQSNRGLFRIELRSRPDAQSEMDGSPLLALAPGAYRNPLALSPDLNRLAFMVYDADQPSLTSGQIKPPNRIKLLTLEGPGSSTIRTVYQTTSALEFLAPLLTWQDNETLLSARSRFGPSGNAGLDLFAAVWIEVPSTSGAPDPNAISVTIPASQALLDLTGCSAEQAALLVLLNQDGSLQYTRWNVLEPLAASLTVPNNLTRAFVCWRSPVP